MNHSNSLPSNLDGSYLVSYYNAATASATFFDVATLAFCLLRGIKHCKERSVVCMHLSKYHRK